MAVQLGDTGPEVEQVQAGLAGLHFPIVVDGIFGPRTDDSVRALQLVVGLVPDGIVGPLTQVAMFEEPGAWAEVSVNADPTLPLKVLERTDTVETTASQVVFEAEVKYPRVDVAMFFNPVAANAGLAHRIEQLVVAHATAAHAPDAVFGPSFIRGEIEATVIAPTMIGMHGNLSVYVSGAAHPNPMPFLATMDLAADAFIAAEQLWMPGVDYPTALRDIALLTIAPGPGLAPTPGNFKHQTVTPTGIKVVFDPYQVAPGAAGAPHIIAPWADIESIVRPSIVARCNFQDPGGPGPHV